MRIRDLIYIKDAFMCWEREKRHYMEACVLAERLKEVGLPEMAAHNLGTAIGLARELGIELYHGLSYADCRAILPRNNWHYDNGDPEEIFLYGQFLCHKRKYVTEIQMLDCDICFAIAKCAIEAKRAEVI